MKLNPIGANQTELTVGELTVLFSYQTPVAAHYADTGDLYEIDRQSIGHGNWSRTSEKHVTSWLRSIPTKEGRIRSESGIPVDGFERLIQYEVERQTKANNTW